MNIAKALEIAFAHVIRAYGEIGAGVTIRCWQTLRADGSWNAAKDRDFPVIDVRCSPPAPDESAESTAIAECAVLCGTKAADDKDHAAISALYAGTQDAMDRLYAGFRGNATHAPVYAAFLAKLTDAMGATDAALFSFGGLTFGGGTAPYDDDGVNMIGLTMRVHFSRSDF